MKRIIPIIIALVLLACLVGCDSSSDNNAETTHNGTVVVTQPSSTSVVENTSTASSNPAAYIYDGTGDAKGAIIATVKWNDRDKIQIINDMIHSDNVISNKKKDKEESEIPIENLEMFENIAYVMAQHADPKNVPADIMEWLEQFETFSIYQILPAILELWNMNEETQSQAKKNLDQVAGS